MVLSDMELRGRLIQSKEVSQAKGWWENGDWIKIGNSIVIEPFDAHALGVCSYDLHVGEEYISLRDPHNTRKIEEEAHIDVDPSETVLILTQEYICLPKNVMAMIVPRATWIFEGTSLCATRVEPTWYGKLLIAFTNMAKNPIALGRGEEFCTCYWAQVGVVERVLTKETTPHLGRTRIGTIKFSHARPQKPLSPEKVDREAIEKVVDLYGWPWDVVRGMLVLTQRELQEYVDHDVAPNIVEDATSAATSRAYDELLRLNRQFFWAGVTLGVGFLGLLGYLISRL